MTAFTGTPTAVSFIPATGVDTTLLRDGRGTGESILIVPDDPQMLRALPHRDSRRAFVLDVADGPRLVPFSRYDRARVTDRGASVGLGILRHELARLGVQVPGDSLPVFEVSR